MEIESDKTRKKETAQEAFRKLREKDKIEMLDRLQKIEDAQERAKAEKMRKKGKDKEHNESPRKVKFTEREDDQFGTSPARPISATEPFPSEQTPIITKSEHAGHAEQTKIGAKIESRQRRRRRRGRCTNCCGGLPGKGPGSARDGGSHCCCTSGNRIRGGSDTDRSVRENSGKTQARSSSEDLRTPRRLRDHHCGHSSKMSFVMKDLESFPNGLDVQFDSFPIGEDEQRERGGCGGCGAPSSCCRPCPPPPPPCQKPAGCREPRCPNTKPSCPCGGCGGAACSDNPGGGGSDGGCCGGNRPRGLPCKCKCQSCDTFRPLGGCGGRSCGKIYSCAGSSGGKCCFPRNTKRRSGADCCGGADSNCGGCC